MQIAVVSGFGEFFRPCCICWQGFETGETLAVAYDNGRRLGYICPQCMEGGKEQVRAVLRARASELLRLAEGPIECDTWGAGDTC